MTTAGTVNEPGLIPMLTVVVASRKLPGPHVGVLGVDRYAAYGKVWLGTIQYCMEHYKRNVGDLLEAEPENKEYKKYIPKFIELLKEAMTLRTTIRRLKPRTIQTLTPSSPAKRTPHAG